MKKLLSVLLCVVVLFGFSACVEVDDSQSEQDHGNEYVIYFDFGELKDNVSLIKTAESKRIKKGETFSLESPSCKAYKFIGWVIKDSEELCVGGTYVWDNDLYLIAKWEVNNDSSEWTPNL